MKKIIKSNISVIALFLLCFPVYGNSYSFEPVIVDFNLMHYHTGPLNLKKINSSKKWKSIKNFNKKELSGFNEIWIRITLPEIRFEERAISIRSYLNMYEVYTYEKIAEHSKKSEKDLFRYYSNRVISLKHYDTDTVYLRILYSSPASFGKIFTVLTGEKEALYKDIINEQSNVFSDILDEMFLGMVLFIFGTVSVFVFIIRFKHRDYPFLTFGLFSILTGISYLCGMKILKFVNLSPLTFYLVENISFLIMPVMLFAFIEQIFITSRLTFVIRRLWQLNSIAAAFTAVMILKNNIFESILISIFFLSCIVAFTVILKSDKQDSLNVRKPFLLFLMLLIILSFNRLLEIVFNIHVVNDFLKVFFDLNWQLDIFGFGILSLTFALGYILIRHYTDLIRNMQKASIELEKNKSEILKLSQAKLESQFDALKNQLNPHFLFNNFSTLISIIEDDSDAAVNFVQELSSVYRYILKTRVSELVDLKTEIEFVNSYEYLMKKRFGDNLKLSINVPFELLKFKLPPFSLQLLIENAVKHNIISKKKPLTISIDEEDFYIVVSNNLQKKNVIERSTNIGLDNIEKRYRYFTERKIYILADEKRFTVKLPLLKRKEWQSYESDNN